MCAIRPTVDEQITHAAHTRPQLTEGTYCRSVFDIRLIVEMRMRMAEEKRVLLV